MTSSALQLHSAGALTSSSAGSMFTPSPPLRLDSNNFTLWKGLTLPNLAGAGLHGHLNGTEAAPAKTIRQGTGDAAVDVPNPAYTSWWTVDQKVIGLLLGSMEPDIACQLISCDTAAAVWAAVHTMFGAQSRANVRHIRRQLQTMRKEEMPAAQYMHKMKALADTMAAAGSPISDDELVDYIITGLGPDFNAIAASLTVGNRSVSYTDFYSHILSFEALQSQQAQVADWSSSANAASRTGSFNHNRSRAPDFNPATYGGSRPAGNTYQQGQGRPFTGGNDRPQSGGYGGGNGYQNNGQNNGRKKQRPRCQICTNWGHEAADCRNRYNPEYRVNNRNNQRSVNAATTSFTATPPWLMDTGATDHFTNDLERLHTHERYGGKDNVQVANGAGQGHEENSSSR